MSNHEEIKSKLDRILSYIEDDPKTGRKGIFRQVQENSEDIEKNKDDISGVKSGIETDKKVLTGKVTVLGFIGGAVLWVLKWIF